MKKTLILSIYLLCCTLGSSAQAPALPDMVKAKLPEILSTNSLPRMEELRRTFKENSDWGQNRRAKSQLWVVFSDRANNTTYTTPEKTKKLGELNFGEKVCIADIKGDMALVYVDKNNHYPDIPKTITSKGWVPMTNLLLWRNCPTDEKDVQMKGIIAINLNNMTKDEDFQDKLYKSPDNLRNSSSLNTDMHFYYVLKETDDGEYALLCTGAQVNDPQTFYGWVNKNAYTEWNQRSCLEPNWLPNYVEKHSGPTQRVYIYENQTGDNATIAHWEYGIPNGIDDAIFMYRMHPDQLRFPVLSQPDANGMVKCTSFADRTEHSINAANKFAGNISSQANEIGKQTMQMNIILAVEASTEMSKYFPAVKNALSVCKDFAERGQTVQVGLILYSGLNSGSSSVTMVPLSNYDDAQLESKLQESQATARLTGERNVALSQAIEDAVTPSKMGFNRDQSNLLLIIGNHGTADASWSEQKLLDKLVANNIQLASIQVIRSSAGSSKRYFDAMESLVKKNVDTQYKKMDAQAVFQAARDRNRNLTNDGYVFTSSLSSEKGGNPLFASVRYSKQQDREMSPEELTTYIKNGINNFSNTVTTSKNMYEKALNDVDFYPAFLIKKLGEKGYKNWLQVKAISAYGGYARVNGLGDNDEWKAVLYLSSAELTALIEKLRPLSLAAQDENPDRTKFVDAIRELLKAQLGGSYDENAINAMEPEELENRVYGIVNVKSDNTRFTKHSLKDWVNRRVVRDDEYFDMLSKFDKKYKKLTQIPRNYKYRMEIDHMFYYWIPLEDLP